MIWRLDLGYSLVLAVRQAQALSKAEGGFGIWYFETDERFSPEPS
jgi:hypothetical protein